MIDGIDSVTAALNLYPGQEFTLHEKADKYIFKIDRLGGLLCRAATDKTKTWRNANNLWHTIISCSVTLKAKDSNLNTWRPKIGEKYYIPQSDGIPLEITWKDSTLDRDLSLHSSICKTKQEAILIQGIYDNVINNINMIINGGY